MLVVHNNFLWNNNVIFYPVFLLATFVLNLISILLIERFESYWWNKNLTYGNFCCTRHSKAFWSQLQNSWIVAFPSLPYFSRGSGSFFLFSERIVLPFPKNFWHYYSSYWFIIIFKYVIQSWVILTGFIYRTLLSYLLKKKNYISLIILLKYFLFLNTLSDLFPSFICYFPLSLFLLYLPRFY